jgi:hypothetical protein
MPGPERRPDRRDEPAGCRSALPCGPRDTRDEGQKAVRVNDMMNLTDPIIPGISAAGVAIHDVIQPILSSNKPLAEDRFGNTDKYTFEGVTLWARDGRITQIGVAAPYSGKLNEKIGIGSTIGDVENALGKVSEDAEDSLVVRGSGGWSFDTEPWKRRNPRDNRGAKVTEIFVFRPAADAK